MTSETGTQTEEARIKQSGKLDSAYAEILLRHAEHPEYIIQNIGLFIKRHHSLARLLHHYELFRSVKDVPGSIVECGVFRGETLLLWGKLLEIFCMGDRTKTVYGFDHFRGLDNLSHADGPENAAMHRGAYDGADTKQELLELIALFDSDRFVPAKPRIQLIDGDITDTIPEFVASHPGVRISLLHLDMDLYEPTLLALKHLYPLVVKGGVVVLDEYGFENFPGESRALEDYFGDDMPALEKFGWFSNPGAFFYK